jgi:hypothetical protein
MTAKNTPERLRKIFSIATVQDGTGCLLWQRSKNQDGYGRITVNQRLESAHRISWALFNGPIPPGMQVLHKCDVPSCVNVEHLFLGTVADNIHDAMRKGRHFPVSGTKVKNRARGSRSGMAKLTEQAVSEIRRAYQEDGSFGRIEALGREFGVSGTVIASVIRRRTWTHVA